MNNLVLLNGEILPAAEAQLNRGDRGQQFGDGIYCLVPVYNGKAFALLPYLEEFFNSAIKLKLPGIYTVDELVEFHEALIKETGMVNGEIYTQLTRGVGSYGLAFPDVVVPELTMYAIEHDRSELPALQASGVNIITEPDVRWQCCDINTLNLLPEVLAKQKAREARAFDTLFVRDKEKVTESTEANIFIYKDDILWTPPADKLVHGRIMRRLVKERLAPEVDIQLVEKHIKPEFLLAADEVFLVGTRCEIMPVTKVDRQFIADRKPGKVAQTILERYQDFVAHECPKQ